MNENKFYIHFDSINLPHYFSSACIKPSKYIINRKDDIQSKFSGFILLSNIIYSVENDCSIEIIVTEKEKRKFIFFNENEKLYLYNGFFPISRVKNIFFKDNNTKDKIITLVNLSSAFLPKNLSNVNDSKDVIDYSNIVTPENLNISDLGKQIKEYDSILGAFALMKIAKDEYMNYSENYFSTLAFFSHTIENELKTSNKKISDIYWDAFVGKDKFKILYSLINKVISEDDLYNIAKLENQIIQKDRISGTININSLDRITYIIAVLYNYGLNNEGRRNKIDSLIINNFKNEIKSERSEVIAFCYGFNRGYSAFSNKYNVNLKESIVKYELNSKVDYYTIESVYQYVINKTRSLNFEYLDDWCPKYQNNIKRLKKTDFKVLDKVIIGEIIKVGTSKWWSKILQLYFQKNNEDLFRPFLEKFYFKIKEDIEDNYIDEIENKNEEINNLKKELEKLKESNLLKQDINYKDNLLFQEQNQSLKESSEINYEIAFNESLNLINELNKISKSQKAKNLINNFIKKYKL